MQQARGAVITGLGLGAGLMFFLDPERGRRRRALVRDRMVHAARVGTDAVSATRRDVAHRAAGAAARLRGARDAAPVDDTVLVERVRARLGRVVSHPRALHVESAAGVVTLRGPILTAEVGRLLREVKRVRGVVEVIDALDARDEAGDLPALQGNGAAPAPRWEIAQRHWSPTTRLLVGAAGTALAGYGSMRRDVAGAALAATGVGLLARAATDLEMRRLVGIGAGRRAVDVQKSVTIDAPVEDVFAFWTSYESFPRFMSRVLDVRRGDRDGLSHWTVTGPAGVPVQFDAEESVKIRNERFGWRTIEGSVVAHSGVVRFEPAGGGRTRVQVRMSYNPPGGWLGHEVAAAFGVDPKSSLDADLARMKTLLETGRVPRDAAQPASEHAPH